MTYDYQCAAIRVLDCLHRAERDLLGTPVITHNGTEGVVKEIRLDDLHGFCFTFDDPLHSFDEVECGRSRDWKPVSTIRMKT